MKSIMFQKGVPTGADVKKLMDAFGIPAQGTLIPYTEIESVINEEKGSYRWGSVISAWRRLLECTHNVILKAETRKGYKALTDKERVHFCADGHKQGLKKIVVAGDRASRTNRKHLTEEERRAADYLEQVAGTIKVTAATEVRKIGWL